jgi:hypothetical protein
MQIRAQHFVVEELECYRQALAKGEGFLVQDLGPVSQRQVREHRPEVWILQTDNQALAVFTELRASA